MFKLVIVLLLVSYSLANAETIDMKYYYSLTEKVLKDTVNDPDSVKLDSMLIYDTGKGKGLLVSCGSFRAKNAFGGVIRQNFVINGADKSMPVYIGPIPLDDFKDVCTGTLLPQLSLQPSQSINAAR